MCSSYVDNRDDWTERRIPALPPLMWKEWQRLSWKAAALALVVAIREEGVCGRSTAISITIAVAWGIKDEISWYLNRVCIWITNNMNFRGRALFEIWVVDTSRIEEVHHVFETIDGDWLRKSLCVEDPNTRDNNFNTRDSNIFPKWMCRHRNLMCFGLDT